MKQRILELGILMALATFAGCSHLPDVKAWEKGNLAKPNMVFDVDHLDQRYTQHVYDSKENSSGGASVGGGGCGCN